MQRFVLVPLVYLTCNVSYCCSLYTRVQMKHKHSWFKYCCHSVNNIAASKHATFRIVALGIHVYSWSASTHGSNPAVTVCTHSHFCSLYLQLCRTCPRGCAPCWWFFFLNMYASKKSKKSNQHGTLSYAAYDLAGVCPTGGLFFSWDVFRERERETHTHMLWGGYDL